jgi:hypothetical protein
VGDLKSPRLAQFSEIRRTAFKSDVLETCLLHLDSTIGLDYLFIRPMHYHFTKLFHELCSNPLRD